MSEEQIESFEAMTWKSEDRFCSGFVILGITALNELTNEEFLNKLYEYSQIIIRKNKINDEMVIWKHDINNGILSRLQMNKYFDKDKYEVVNQIRERLWKKPNEHSNDDEVIEIFGNSV